MTLLVTGGTGFVMSNLVRQFLASEPQARAVVLDMAGPDRIAERFFAGLRQRIDFRVGDVTKPETWRDLPEVTAIVHGATITPVTDGAGRSVEREIPARILDVNIMGTVNALEFARRQRGLARFIYCSSGAVYADEGPAPMPEDGYVAPVQLYSVSKYASERITQRYAALFGLPAVSVRFSGVFGPMDRPTPGRDYACVPNRIAHMAIAGQTITVNGRSGTGDWIYAPDLAAALIHLLRARRPQWPVYNIAYGHTATLGDLLDAAAAKIPGTRHKIVPEAEAAVSQDKRNRGGRWGAYDISRIKNEFGWHPRPLHAALGDYIDWIGSTEEA